MKVKSESEAVQSCPTFSDAMDCKPTRLLRPWDFPGKSTGGGAIAFLLPTNLTSAVIMCTTFINSGINCVFLGKVSA